MESSRRRVVSKVDNEKSWNNTLKCCNSTIIINIVAVVVVVDPVVEASAAAELMDSAGYVLPPSHTD